MPETTNLNSLVLNVLTKDQYTSATKDANQIYMVTDENMLATTTEDGLMSAADKVKLDSIESGATAGVQNVWYGTCTTAAATTAKIVTTTTGDFVLTTGATVYVKFSTAHTSTTRITLNVDGTGAQTVNTTSTNGVTAYQIAAGQVLCFVWDGEAFRVQGGATATTTYYGLTKLSSSTSSTSTTLAATPSAVKSAYDLANAALPKSGGTMTGALVAASNNTGASVVRNISYGTELPSNLAEGEIFILLSE